MICLLKKKKLYKRGLHPEGINLSPHDAQALIVDYSQVQSTVYNLNRTINRMKAKINELESQINKESSMDYNENQEAIQKTIERTINEHKLGSTIRWNEKLSIIAISQTLYQL